MSNEEKLIAQQKKLLFGRQMFDIELTTRCNKHCYLCPREKLTRINREMSDDIFSMLLTWLPKDCDVFFAGFGEPLLHEKCTDFIQQLHDSGRKTSIMTNGILLSNEKIKDLFSAGLDKLQISIIQKTDLEKITHFTNLISDEYKNRIVFNIIKEEKMNDPYEMLSILRENGWHYCVKLAHNRAGLLFPAENNSEIQTCATFFCDTYINADGKIQVCSNDINNFHEITSIQNMSFLDLIEYKTTFLGNKKICKICSHCTDEYRTRHFMEVE